jgi:hypothetical protein
VNPLSGLVKMPGPVFAHLVVLVVLACALSLTAFTGRVRPAQKQPRLAMALWVLAASQVALLTLSLTGLVGWPLFEAYASVAEPGVLVLSVLWLAWIWCFPDPSSTADRLLGLSTGVTIFLIVAELFLSVQGSLPALTAALVWAAIGLLVSTAGLVKLIMGRDPSWAAGAGSLSLFWLFLAAYILVERLAGQGMVLILLAQLVAFPSVFWLPLRASSGEQAYESSRIPEGLWESWFRALPELTEGSAGSFPQRLLQLMTQIARADMGIWLSLPAEQGEPVLVSFRSGDDEPRPVTATPDPSVVAFLDQLIGAQEPRHLRHNELTGWLDHVSGDNRDLPVDFLPSRRYAGDHSAILLRESAVPIRNLFGFWRVILETGTIASCWKASAKMKSEEARVRFSKEEPEATAQGRGASAPQRGQTTSLAPSCTLESLAEGTIARVRKAIIAKGLTIALNVPPEGSVQADCAILEDLLSSALAYVCAVCRPEATVLLDLASLQDEDRGRWLFFQARAGFEPSSLAAENPEKLPEPDSALQLSKARSLAKQLGGTVWTESGASARTTIQVFLPVQSGEDLSRVSSSFQ